jgi:sugar lactone lactonase YvrE
MVVRGDKAYLVELPSMRVVVLDIGGAVREAIDIAAALKMTDRQVADTGLGGFDADNEGNIYFTITSRFKAYRRSADGKVESFGQPGGTPGKFSVIHGIAADRSGNIYVVDTLKCVVSSFDRDFNFLYNFGFRTNRPGGLVAPKDVSISGNGRFYVTQQANRGVNVYQVSSN